MVKDWGAEECPMRAADGEYGCNIDPRKVSVG